MQLLLIAREPVTKIVKQRQKRCFTEETLEFLENPLLQVIFLLTPKCLLKTEGIHTSSFSNKSFHFKVRKAPFEVLYKIR